MSTILLCNPPYLPTPEELHEEKVLTKAWDSGFYGTDFITNLFKKINGYLKPGGLFMFVQSSLASMEKTLHCLKESGFIVEQILKKLNVEFGPLSLKRLDHLKLLKQEGLSEFTFEAGKYYETLYFVKARKE